MSLFDANIPQPGDFLSDSQQDLLNNMQQLDTTFGVDHYTFSDATANNGKHNIITTPRQPGAENSPHPTTASAEPRFYAYRNTNKLGALHWSRKGSNAVPSPVTRFQSQSALISLTSGQTTDVLDFTGMPDTQLVIYASGVSTPNGNNKTTIAFVRWFNGTTSFNIENIILVPAIGTRLEIQNDGNTLQVKNTSTGTTIENIVWTVDFLRTWTP